MFYVYLLLSTSGNTYIGATIDIDRRLRQHNKEISGGAYATGVKVLKGEKWERAVHISGFPSWQSALQFEWRWKHLTRNYKSNINPLERRIRALNDLLLLKQSTSKAIPYIMWDSPPLVHFELNTVTQYIYLMENHTVIYENNIN